MNNEKNETANFTFSLILGLPWSHVGRHFAMARNVASMSFRPRRDVGSMRGARSSILESMKWTVQVRRAAITMRHHVHFNSGVLDTPSKPSGAIRQPPRGGAKVAWFRYIPVNT